MTDTHGARRAGSPTPHAAHDLFVIAAAADRDADADEATRATATAQMAACHDCAALFADLRLIREGLTGLPRTMPVARDFRISPERAATLRTGGWRRFVGGFARGPSIRPLASAFTALGVAGLLLTVALPAVSSLGGSTAAILSTVGSSIGAPAPQSGPGSEDSSTGAGKAGATQEPPTSYGGQVTGSAASPVPAYGVQTPSDRTALGSGGAGSTTLPQTVATGPSLLLTAAWISLALLLAGLGLFAADRFRGRDPAG